ncbi:MAG TPA: SCO family protein [Candidatus Acidoferrales bacterium]|jgi:protein SCO1|nr:SCO family protein [Candidatus Acidoferrales bacterium]
MQTSKRDTRSERCRTRFLFAILLAAVALIPAACSKKAEPPPEAQTKRYHLVGKVLSIDKDHGSAMIDGQEIVGFMSAMAMAYPVRDTKALAALNPGDEITADVVVADDGAYLENIVVIKKGDAKGPTGSSNPPQPGDKVPDFAMVNQDGKRIHLSEYQGNVLLVTFIYTRCPFPDYCPLVSRNFSKIYATLRKEPSLGSKIHLLSVSFDPEHDTPAVLRQYAETFRATTGGNPFARWQFAAVPPKELASVANFFGLYYRTEGDQITHSMSTTVISPEGTVYKWYQDNEWKPADLIGDATQALHQGNQPNAGPPTSASVPTA